MLRIETAKVFCISALGLHKCMGRGQRKPDLNTGRAELDGSAELGMLAD